MSDEIVNASSVGPANVSDIATERAATATRGSGSAAPSIANELMSIATNSFVTKDAHPELCREYLESSVKANVANIVTLQAKDCLTESENTSKLNSAARILVAVYALDPESVDKHDDIGWYNAAIRARAPQVISQLANASKYIWKGQLDDYYSEGEHTLKRKGSKGPPLDVSSWSNTYRRSLTYSQEDKSRPDCRLEMQWAALGASTTKEHSAFLSEKMSEAHHRLQNPTIVRDNDVSPKVQDFALSEWILSAKALEEVPGKEQFDAVKNSVTFLQYPRCYGADRIRELGVGKEETTWTVAKKWQAKLGGSLTIDEKRVTPEYPYDREETVVTEFMDATTDIPTVETALAAVQKTLAEA